MAVTPAEKDCLTQRRGSRSSPPSIAVNDYCCPVLFAKQSPGCDALLIRLHIDACDSPSLPPHTLAPSTLPRLRCALLSYDTASKHWATILPLTSVFFPEVSVLISYFFIYRISVYNGQVIILELPCGRSPSIKPLLTDVQSLIFRGDRRHLACAVLCG